MTKSDHSKNVKPEKFTGVTYKRRANQMRYWLTTLGMLSAIDIPESSSQLTTSNSPVYGPLPEQSYLSTFASDANPLSSHMKPEVNMIEENSSSSGITWRKHKLSR